MNNNNEEIEYIDYSLKSSIKSIKMSIFLLVFFVSVLISYLSIPRLDMAILENKVAKIIPGCNINIGSPEFEYFMPKIVFNDTNIPGSCLGGREQNLKIDKFTLNFNFFSFSPFGLSFLAELEFLNQKIEAKIVPSFNSVSVLIENNATKSSQKRTNKVSLKEISPFIPKVTLTGDIYLSTIYTEIDYKAGLKDLTLNIASDNLKLPSQKIMGFKTPNLNFAQFLLQANMVSNSELHLKKFILGEEKSPVIAQIVGKVDINKRKFPLSKINLETELKISEAILNDYPILKFPLQQFDSKNKFYQIPIKGTIARPKFGN